MTAKLARPVAVLAVCFVVGVAAFAFWPSSAAFDSQGWQQAMAAQDDAAVDTRFDMANDLVESERLIGLTEPEVAELLGDAEETAYFEAYGLAYNLGPEESYISIDSDWLLVDFDDDGLVETVVVQSD